MDRWTELFLDEGESDEYDIDNDVYRDDSAHRRDDQPYFLQCDRYLRTIYGFRDHCRMSSMHPWWCDGEECDTDFERESDLEVRVCFLFLLHFYRYATYLMTMV
jgi:hypothetical protein